MKVEELIERLKRDYTPETELYVEYWDKDILDNYGLKKELTDEEWGEVVSVMEERERIDQSLAADALVEAAEEVLEGREE